MNNHKLWYGIIMILTSATFSCTGQLLWKLATIKSNLLLLLFGAMLYVVGACFMMVAFKFGELSILHPIMSFGYVLSIILGRAVLGESISLTKIAGIVVIIYGIYLLSNAGSKELSSEELK